MPVPALSTIEEQIVLLVAQGHDHRTIAEELDLSLKTVEWHLVRARGKLGRAATLHDRVQRAEESARTEGGVG